MLEKQRRAVQHADYTLFFLKEHIILLTLVNNVLGSCTNCLLFLVVVQGEWSIALQATRRAPPCVPHLQLNHQSRVVKHRMAFSFLTPAS